MPPLRCSPVRSKPWLRGMSFWSPNSMTFSMTNHRQITLSSLFSLSMLSFLCQCMASKGSGFQTHCPFIKMKPSSSTPAFGMSFWYVTLCFSPRSVAELLGQPVSVCYWTGGWVWQVAMAGGLQTRVNDWMWERGKAREAPGRPDEGKARTGPWFPMEAQQRLLFKIK